MLRLRDQVERISASDPNIIDAKSTSLPVISVLTQTVEMTRCAKIAANRYIDNKYCLESFFTQSGFGTSELFYQIMQVEQVDNID